MIRNGRRRTRTRSAPRGYPRPLLQRADWISLDGSWEFCIDPDGTLATANDADWSRAINVPFAPESPASGINQTGLFKCCWYRRQFQAPQREPGQRLILHFGAVDYSAKVWVNDQLAVEHEGGYTPFCADITDLLIDSDDQTIVVRAEDDPLDLAKPRGKQDWQAEPHSIWYFRTTGIWQSVWLESVNATRIDQLQWTANVESWQIALRCRIEGPTTPGMKLRVTLRHDSQTLAEDVYSIERNEVSRRIQLIDPGIDNARDQMLWSPSSPQLIDAELELLDESGNMIDVVASYTAMRCVHIAGNRLLLNGRPLQLRLVLDQGYWPEGGLTAPDDEAYRRDVELVKSMGFNGVRKHQKIEDPRFLYWADKLGLLVWEEMPSVYRFSDQSIERLTRQWIEAIERDRSHPCIIAWVPFNESWGVPDLPLVPAQQHAIQGLYHLTKALDSTRPVIGNDGWEAAATDIIGIHDYDADPRSIEKRYSAEGSQLCATERPGHRVLLLNGFDYAGQPIMLTEFGGIAFSKDSNHTWGYSRAGTADEFGKRYSALLAAIRSLPLLSGFCYTQFTDTYQEANGLLYMDRTPKLPLEQIALATAGAGVKP